MSAEQRMEAIRASTVSGETSLSFPKEFLFGAATASYQIEGAARVDGRGRSIWDTFSHTAGKIADGSTGDDATDHYHRYGEDIDLMKELGLGAYRFSIAWPRILPDGGAAGSSGAATPGGVNQKGIDFYSRLVDRLLEAGIQPVATLYHWDLPQALEDAGGWPARDTAYRFADYADLMFDALGDRVAMWATLNEPFCSSILGYLDGVHAPGYRDAAKAYRAAHHLLLGHGLALQRYRDSGLSAPIGITVNAATPRPATAHAEDHHAADRAMDLATRLFIDPLLNRGYPERHLAAVPGAEMPIEEGDMDVIAQKIDYLGINFYHEEAVRFDANAAEEFRFVPQYQAQTEMGWPITPEGFARHLRSLYNYSGGIPLYVTENGAAMPDSLSEDGTACHDYDRIAYLRSHLAACSRVIQEGVDLRGYFLWSFIDNFEWAFGYTKRFGVVYCDYETQRRIPKDSFYFYRDVIAGAE